MNIHLPLNPFWRVIQALPNLEVLESNGSPFKELLKVEKELGDVVRSPPMHLSGPPHPWECTWECPSRLRGQGCGHPVFTCFSFLQLLSLWTKSFLSAWKKCKYLFGGCMGITLNAVSLSAHKWSRHLLGLSWVKIFLGLRVFLKPNSRV